MVTFPAARHHRPLASTKLHCLVTQARVLKKLIFFNLKKLKLLKIKKSLKFIHWLGGSKECNP